MYLFMIIECKYLTMEIADTMKMYTIESSPVNRHNDSAAHPKLYVISAEQTKTPSKRDYL